MSFFPKTLSFCRMEEMGQWSHYVVFFAHKLSTRTLGLSSRIRNQNGLRGEGRNTLLTSGDMIRLQLREQLKITKK